MEATNEELNGPAQSSLPVPATGNTPEPATTDITADVKAPAAKRAPRTRATTRKAPAAATDDEAAGTTDSSGETAAEPAPKAARATRTRKAPAKKAAPAADTASEAPADAAVEAGTEAPAEEQATAAQAEAPKKPARAPRTRKTAAKAAPAAESPADSAAPADGAAPDAADTSAASADEPVAPAKAPRTRKAPARKTRATAEAPAEAPATESLATETAATEGAASQAPAASTTEQPTTEQPTAAADEVAGTTAPTAANPFAIPDSPVSVLFQAPDLSAVVPASRGSESTDEQDASADQDQGGRNRQSRRSRSRSRDDSSRQGEDHAEADSEGEEGNGTSSRRRRRRRRGDADLELTGGQDDDPPNTVTRVRGPRATTEAAPSNKVTSVKGSTRLEAKRQRRRDSRDAGRRRHVITEAEFLARRESVDRQMVVRQNEDRIQIGVLEDGVLAEHFVSKTQQDSLIGNVYVGKVQNVLPSMEAAFIDIGRGRNAVLYAGEVNWDVAGLEGQPRRIEHALKSGDSVLVQVTKDPVGHKGARLTSQISLPGRYLVYVPGGSMTGISRKLPDVERNRLKKILKDHLPQNAGVIVRTAAEGASEQELMNDINRLRAQWEGIESASTSTKTTPPELLYAEPDLTIKVVRDVFNEDFTKLIVSGEQAWDTIEAYVMYVAPDLISRLEKWTSGEDIFASHRIEEQIHKALDRKVFLPSGGSLVIDRTEAMTVVDVNTGKFTGSGGNLEETVTKNNLEAAEEIVRQLRLRDIGGIIVIDFIDMVLEANRDLVLRRLVECLGRDRTKHQVAEVTSLGLVQMTRKRMGTGLLEVFSENCEACNGRGVVTHDEPVEHRRSSGGPAEQNNHKRNDRNDRKPRGNRHGKGGEVDHTTEFTAPEPKPQDPEAEAKAEAARAAFASIAAAAHAAHQDGATAQSTGHDGGAPTSGGTGQEAGGSSGGEDQRDGGSRRRGRGRSRGRGRAGSPETSPQEQPQNEQEPVQQQAQQAPAQPAPAAAGGASEVADEGPVVSLAGEPVRLPRARRSRRATAPTQTPDLTLESLSAAFGATPEPARETAAPEQAKEPAKQPAAVEPAATPAPVVDEPVAPQEPAAATQPAAAAQPARKPRRSRSASSAQGSANTPIERKEAPASSAAAGTSHVAKLDPRAGKAQDTAGETPVMLGVGVPAEEL
ncbi:Rne/Rng family ribonuclease [Arthrobacter sp. JSM 101049]|uniref:Rne/Rng family ribonuclease n=1 Tax=Arthrobacter sp. JSM 101049 TaxID=929097 RepID=UPI00356B4D99